MWRYKFSGISQKYVDSISWFSYISIITLCCDSLLKKVVTENVYSASVTTLEA